MYGGLEYTPTFAPCHARSEESKWRKIKQKLQFIAQLTEWVKKIDFEFSAEIAVLRSSEYIFLTDVCLSYSYSMR